jgi:D-alanyl-D-alanine carboxypeptidase
MQSVVIATAIAATLGAVAPVTAQSTAGLSARLDMTLEEFHVRYGFPGATTAIALPDGTVTAAATGLADVESGRTMTTGTPMPAASIGKTFVAAAVLALESEGRLSRADLLADHLGDLPWFDDLPNAQSINIGHLLHHSAGLPDHVSLPEFRAAWAQMTTADATLSPEELTGFVIGMDPLFEAGTAWAYSDTGYILLGLVIEAVTGKSRDEVVRTRFLEPLMLSGTFPSDRRDLPGIAVGYVAPDNPFSLPERTADAEGRLLWDPAVENAGGGLASTSHDLALWGHLLFGGEVMAEPYLDRLLEGVPVSPDTPGILYGAGVAIYADTPRGPVYGHGGWIPAYVSSLRHYADHGVTVAFQINTDAGLLDDSSDLVPMLEAALADLAIEAVQ